MLGLMDVLAAKGIRPDDFKIHLATGVKTSPLQAYFEGKFKRWQEVQNAKNFECSQIVSLISLGGDRWLFAGVYRVLGVRKGRTTPYQYRTELLGGQEDILGRIIVRYKRQYRASYIWGRKYGKYLELSEIKPSRMTIEGFPGYNNVVVSHLTLKIIVDQAEPSWKSALSNVKGVYLISDTKTGRAYVGSATADEGLWHRWAAYAQTGHGGNAELRKLVSKRGPKYANNFQYSVLEIADSHASKEAIEAREAHWKNVLLSREFGYNSN